MLKTLSAAALALLIAASTQAAAQLPSLEPFQVNARNIGACETYDPHDPYNRHNGLGAIDLRPIGAVYSYVQSQQKASLREFKLAEISVKYIGQPQHGSIKTVSRDGGMSDLYVPNAGYSGNDRYVAEVRIKGVKFRVVGYIRPSSDVLSGYDDLCRRLGLPGSAWKIAGAKDLRAGDTVLPIPASSPGNRMSSGK